MESFLNFLKQLFKWTAITVVSLIVVIYTGAFVFDKYNIYQEKIDEQFVLQCVPKDLIDLPDGAISTNASFLIRSSKKSRSTDRYYADAWIFGVKPSFLGSDQVVYAWSKDFKIVQTERYVYITKGLYDILKLQEGAFDEVSPFFTLDRTTLDGFFYDSDGMPKDPLKCKKVDPKPYFDLIEKTTTEFESSRQI